MTISFNLSDSDAALVEEYTKNNNISASDFAREAMMKAARNAAYLAKLAHADEQIRNGQVVVKTWEELEEMAK